MQGLVHDRLLLKPCMPVTAVVFENPVAHAANERVGTAAVSVRRYLTHKVMDGRGSRAGRGVHAVAIGHEDGEAEVVCGE